VFTKGRFEPLAVRKGLSKSFFEQVVVNRGGFQEERIVRRKHPVQKPRNGAFEFPSPGHS